MTNQNEIEALIDAAVEAKLEARGLSGDENGDWYNLNGLRVAQNPEEYLVRGSIGQTERGLPQYAEAPDHLVPTTDVSYVATDRPGHVRSDAEVAHKLKEHRAVLLEGEAGTGKNTLVDVLADPANIPVYRSNFGMDTSVYELIAEKEVIGDTTITVLGDLAMAAVFGGIFVADEVNMVEGDITSHLHAVTEEKGGRRLKLTGTGRVLTDLPEGEEWEPDKHLGKYIHPAFRVVGTANPVTYAGTANMNNAFRSRFSVTTVEYPGSRAEAMMLHEATGAGKEPAKRLVEDLAGELRAMHSSERGENLMCPTSFRQLQNVLDYKVAHDTSLKAAAEAELVGYAQTQMDKDTIQDAVDDHLSA